MHIIRSMPVSVDDINFEWERHRYPFPGMPKDASPRNQDLLFLAHDGYIVGVAEIVAIRRVDDDDDMDYLEQGAPSYPEKYNYIVTGRLTKLMDGPEYKGTMGIRYIDRLKDDRVRKYLESAAELYRAKPSPKPKTLRARRKPGR
jgi:hypothetical protein